MDSSSMDLSLCSMQLLLLESDLDILVVELSLQLLQHQVLLVVVVVEHTLDIAENIDSKLQLSLDLADLFQCLVLWQHR